MSCPDAVLAATVVNYDKYFDSGHSDKCLICVAATLRAGFTCRNRGNRLRLGLWLRLRIWLWPSHLRGHVRVELVRVHGPVAVRVRAAEDLLCRLHQPSGLLDGSQTLLDLVLAQRAVAVRVELLEERVALLLQTARSRFTKGNGC